MQKKDKGGLVDTPLKWQRLEWEENGKQYSCWKLNTGMFPVLVTGDGGKKEYDKLFSK